MNLELDQLNNPGLCPAQEAVAADVCGVLRNDGLNSSTHRPAAEFAAAVRDRLEAWEQPG